MFKDIILAITPSGICQYAADKAFEFTKRFDANLTMCHVTGMAQGWGEIEYLERSGETDRIKENICEYYKDKMGGLSNCDIQVVAGIPHNEIIRLSRKKNADLIVMGPHTKEYAEKRSKMWGMAGSTLERVAQRAPCPVMVVTREARHEEQRFQTILAATDFSKQAECAVAYAGQMARQYKADLILFHVLENNGQASQSEIAQGSEQAKERMRKEFGELLGGIANVSYEAWEGRPAVEILKLSRLRDVDMILMAHHSKEKDPEKAFLGSVVAQVALNSVCPTMSINRHFDMRCGLMYDQSGDVKDVKSEAGTAEAVES